MTSLQRGPGGVEIAVLKRHSPRWHRVREMALTGIIYFELYISTPVDLCGFDVVLQGGRF